jgi:hypothetical protein
MIVIGFLTVFSNVLLISIKIFRLSIQQNDERNFTQGKATDEQHVIDVALEISRLETMLVDGLHNGTKAATTKSY